MLVVGTRLGPYEILSQLGAGGMGEVYRARDARLDRTVAIKVLPTEKLADLERKKRFVQEARAASALNHPNIVTIYEIDTDSGRDFIAMEFVKGKPLDQVLGRKGLRLTEVLKYAVQMADALARAHAAGIVHRDLKPANIMVTEEGLVKVLDFGLAKLVEPAEIDSWAEMLATKRDEPPSTEAGTIVGTVAYMSPEQAEGKKVDSRSDIFSFGSVLYEMATGQRAFQRDSKILTLSAILRDEPRRVSEVVEGLPKELERVIIRCLRKDPERRWQSMADIKVALTEIKEETDSGTALQSLEQVAPRRRWQRWVWAATLSALVLMICVGIWWVWVRPSAQHPMLPMRTLPFTSYPGEERTPAFSPDGNQVAFAWNGEKGDNYDIYVKLIDGGTPLRLTSNPADECCPAWSPDGRRIAFVRFDEEKYDVIVVPSLGGAEHRLGQCRFSFRFYLSLSWSADGKFLASTEKISQGPDSIFLLSTEGGVKQRLTSPPQGSNDSLPIFSPDGQTLAFGRYKSEFVGDIYLLSIVDNRPRGEPKQLTFDERSIGGWDWTPDGRSLVFSSNRGGGQNLWIVPVSGGEPRQLAVGENASALSIAKHGHRLVYQQALDDLNIWRIAGPGPAWQPMAKKDSVLTKFIASTKTDEDPQFSPDGKKVAFASNRSGSDEIWVCDTDGSNSAQITSLGAPSAGSPRWSPDSRQIAFDSTKEGSWDVYTVSAEGGQSRRLTTESSSDVRPSWSRNGRWIYFGADRSGDWQVWKIPSDGGAAIQVTRQGGREAFESTDGQWLYYAKEFPARGIWRVPVAGGEETQVLDHGLQGFWAVLDTGISLAELDSESIPIIDFFSFATRRLTTITRLPRDLKGRAVPTSSLAVSPDSRWILLLLNDRTESDLVLVENFR